MSDFKKEILSLIGQYGQVGITFVAAIFIGAMGGVYLDQKVFEGRTAPWLTFIGLAFGIAAGFKTLFDVLRQESKKLEDKTEDDKER